MYKTLRLEFSNDKVPVFAEQRGQPYVKYGEENSYPSFLVTLFNRSAIHNSILTSKQFYISGKGFTFDQSGMQGDDIATLKAWIDAPNPYETLFELLEKTVLDEELFGGFYFHGINDKKGKLAELYHLDYCSVRSNADNSEFYIELPGPQGKDGWITPEGDENTRAKFKIIEAYSEESKQKEFVYYFKTYRPNLRTYTLPSYIGGVEAIITDAEISNFHRAEIQNSFKGSKMITFMNGVPSDEEIKQVEKKLKAKFTPTDKAGSIVVDFVDDPSKKAQIENLGDDQFDKKYQALETSTEGKIFKSHKITSPILFGVSTPGALGQRDELINAFNIFSNTYIQPKQARQERVYNIFAPIKGKLHIDPVEAVMPTFGEATLMEILTKDEMRAIIGRKPLDAKLNVNNGIVDQLATLSPLVATKVLNALTPNEVRSIVNKPALPGGGVVPVVTDPATQALATQIREIMSSHKFTSDDTIDYDVFSKYGEPAEKFTLVKHKKFMFSAQHFDKLNDMEKGVLDLVKKTPDISKEALEKILKSDATTIDDALETLEGDGLIEVSSDGIHITKDGNNKKTPTFQDIFIRYRYVERPDAPALVGESRPFCKAMISNPRYFTKEDIKKIGEELGALYGIANYDAFRRRGGWYTDPQSEVHYPFCRHVWAAELVKKK